MDVASTIWNLFFLLGGVVVMLIGMKMMGGGLEKFAGAKMKSLLGKATSNRFAGVGVGTAVTCVIQSSTATTVMLVGFVNIGLMTFAQSANVIMGANIGTTITAWLVSLSGIGEINVGAIAAFIGFGGMMMTMFIKNEKVQNIGNILVGLGLIFVGLEFMSSFATNLMFVEGDKTNPQSWAVSIFTTDHFPLLLLLIGIVLTALVHSSSTITSLMVVLASIGILSFENALFLALGSNIGTCVTAIMSSAGANVNAKRTAVFHLMFNCIGCILFIAPIWILKSEIAGLFASMFTDVGQQIAMFHTLFNIITTALLLPFVQYLVKLVIIVVPEKKKKDGEEHDPEKLTFIDARLLQTPQIAVANVKKEIIRMATIAKENVIVSRGILLDNTNEYEKLKKNEQTLNFLNRGITAFLTKLMGADLPKKEDKIIGTYYHVVSDIERVGDYCENVGEYATRLKQEEMDFSDNAKNELKEVFDKVLQLFDVSMDAFEKLDISKLTEIDSIEDSIDVATQALNDKHIERLKKGSCTPQVGSIYLQTASNLERVGDHITNIAFSMKHYVRENNEENKAN